MVEIIIPKEDTASGWGIKVRAYDSDADRKRAIHGLSHFGYNYFVPFRDVNWKYALQYGVVDWVKAPEVYIDGGYYGRTPPQCHEPIPSATERKSVWHLWTWKSIFCNKNSRLYALLNLF